MPAHYNRNENNEFVRSRCELTVAESSNSATQVNARTQRLLAAWRRRSWTTVKLSNIPWTRPTAHGPRCLPSNP